MDKSLKSRMNNILDHYFNQERKRLPRLLDKNDIMYQTDLDKVAFEKSEDCIFYLRIYQVLINDNEVCFVYKLYCDYKKRRFKIVYYDDYEKVLFADNADDVLSILEILFINNSNKMLMQNKG